MRIAGLFPKPALDLHQPARPGGATFGSAAAGHPDGDGVLPIAGCVICRDEEGHIEACLASLSRCREIIVVDSGSTDGTLAIIARLIEAGRPITLIHQPWLGYARQKQLALSRASQPWCLSLDADERLDAALQASLPALIGRADVAGWRLRRLPEAVGDVAPPPRGVYAKPILRLVRREGARFDERALVHEGLLLPGRIRTARTGLLWHAPRMALPEQVGKEIGYARLRATQRVREGRRPSRLRLVLNPVLYFVRLYLLHRWFLCGRAGFVHAVTGAIYAFAAEAIHFDLWQP